MSYIADEQNEANFGQNLSKSRRQYEISIKGKGKDSIRQHISILDQYFKSTHHIKTSRSIMRINLWINLIYDKIHKIDYKILNEIKKYEC